MKYLSWQLVAYSISLGLFSLFSYALTAPNLVLSSWAPYWQFQTWMWQTFFNNRPLLAGTYAALLILIWSSFTALASQLQRQNTTSWRMVWVCIAAVVLPLIFSSTALSYDVFNYIFNAKMVMVYHANPHIQVALDFPNDPWVRFMHNTHTPAPYAWGWTLWSLIPYSLGLGKFVLTWIWFKLWAVLSLLLLGLVYQRFSPQSPPKWWWVVLLNPLVLLEIVATNHNDLWMMVPALMSFWLLIPKKTAANSGTVTASALSLLASISTKLATIILLPIWAVILVNPSLKKRLPQIVNQMLPWWPLWATLGMALPLLTNRAQQFHPWYLSWPLVWLPLISWHKNQLKWQTWIAGLLIGFSVSSTFRYLPYFYFGNFEPPVLLLQKGITFGGGIFITLLLVLWTKLGKNQTIS